jgi:predicted cobalt transporter CbtA
MFKRIVAAAALAGVMSGALLTLIQHIEIVPLIEAAEVREAANLASQPAHQHPQVNQPWTPHGGWQRTLATAVSNITLAIAFALLLGAAMSLRHSSGWRRKPEGGGWCHPGSERRTRNCALARSG